MKTINFFKSALLAAILLIGGNAWGQEIVYDANFKNQSGAGGSYSSDVSISLAGQSWLASYCYFGSGEFRLGHNKETGLVPAKFLNDQPQGASIEMLWDVNNVTNVSVVATKTYGTCETWYIFESTDQGSTWAQVATGSTVVSTWSYSTTEPKTTARYAFVVSGTKAPRVVLTTVKIEAQATSSVATPEFSPSSGTYTEAQNVEITCATEGAAIYYTTNGDDPSAASTEYSDAIPVSTTTTLKAIAIKDGESSSIASATYTFPTEVENIAAFNATTKGDFVKITGEITIVFSDGNSSVYAQDESGSMLIYDFNYVKTEGLTNGKTLTGLVGTRGDYNGPQMTNVIAPALGEGTPVEPTVVSEVTVDDLHKFVKLEHVQFTETCDLSSRGDQGTLTSNLLVYNRLYNVSLGTAIQGKNYDIEGFVSVYSGTAQLYPISLEINEPAFYYSESSLAFGRVENNQPKELTFTLRGEKLTADATLAVSGDNAAMFTVSPASVTKADDGTIAETTITVTYTPTEAGEHTANLDITSGELVSTISLSGEGILPVLTTPVATAATTITANSFVATWGEVPNATSYELSVWTEQTALNETFDGQEGTGGNDGTWDNGASSDIVGLEDWTLTNGYGANGCIKLGTGSKQGIATTPALNITGDAILTFRAGAWLNSNESTTLLLAIEGNGTLSEEQVTIERGAFNSYSVSLSGIDAATKVSFKGSQASKARFFLDDVVVKTELPITGSPFTVTETSQAITGLTAETTYHYSVVAKAEGYSDSEASNIIDVTTLEDTSTGLCRPVTLEGVSFDGQVIRNAAGLELSVYTVSGVCVKTAAGDIDMSAMPHGIYLVRSANAVLKITK